MHINFSTLNSNMLPDGQKIFVTKKLEDYAETCKKVICVGVSFFLDLALIITCIPAILYSVIKPDFDPKPEEIKQNQPLIVLIHGNGSNRLQWRYFSYALNRLFQQNRRDCSIITLNLDGWTMQNPTKNLEDFAKEVGKRIKETGCTTVVPVGHSLGGLVAAKFAEDIAPQMQITVKKVITISTPWIPPPLLKPFVTLMKWLGRSKQSDKDLMNENGTLTHLKEKIKKSIVPYYNICSIGDWAVPGAYGKIDGQPDKEFFHFVGHYTSMVTPSVIDRVYRKIVSSF